MTVTITRNLTDIDVADTIGNWTGTALDDPSGFQREGSACMGDQASNDWENPYVAITSEDYQNRTIFVWMRSGNPHTEAGDGFGIVLASSTFANAYAYTVGGSDNYGHFVLGWSNFRLDTASLPSGSRVLAGSAPTLSAITAVGGSMGMNSKAAGNADNVFIDTMTYIANGSPALSIGGGTTGARGTFAEMVTEDISTATGKAYGIIRELVGAKAYEMFFGCEWGHATVDTFFEDSDFQLFINGNGSGDGGMTAGNMDMELLTGSGTNLFILTDGVIVGIGTVSNWDLSPAFETMSLNRVVFTDLGTITFPVDGGTLREANDCVFNNCGQVIFEDMDALRCTFNGTTDADGMMFWDDGSDPANQDDFTLVSDGTGHGVHVFPVGAGPFTFNIDGWEVSNFGGGADTTTGNELFLCDSASDADITINVSNGTGTFNNYQRAAGYTGTVDIIQTVTLTVQVDDAASVGLEDVFVSIRDSSDNSLVSEGRTDANGLYQDTAYSYGGDVTATINVRKSSPGDTRYFPVAAPGSIVSTGMSVTVQMIEDTSAGVIDSTRFDISKHGQLDNDISGTTLTAKIKLPGGSSRKLVVAGAYWDSTVNRGITTFTYDGGGMTSITSSFVQEGSEFHEIFLYRHDIPDTDSGTKDIVLTLDGAAPYRAIAFAVINLAGAGAQEDSAVDSQQSVTGNPSISLNNTSQPAIDVMFAITDDLDTFPPAASGVGSIRRADRAVDNAKQLTIVRADRTTTGAHSIGATYDASSKTFVSAGATFAD